MPANILNMTVNIDPRTWDEACALDEVRNEFVVPTIVTIAEGGCPNRVIDIGCGTGYIARSVIARLSSESTQWVLLDRNPEMIGFAKSIVPERSNLRYMNLDLEAVAITDFPDPFDLIILSFSILEMDRLDLLASRIGELAAPSAELLIFLPDTMEDVITAQSKNRGILKKYAEGIAQIEKRNPFTGTYLTFYAHRDLYLVKSFLNVGFRLAQVIRFVTRSNRVHFCLRFGN